MKKAVLMLNTYDSRNVPIAIGFNSEYNFDLNFQTSESPSKRQNIVQKCKVKTQYDMSHMTKQFIDNHIVRKGQRD